MRFFWGKCIATFICGSLFIVCSCEQHPVGENPEVQNEHADLGNESPAAPPEAISPTPPAKPTPAEFFPTKP